MRAWMKKCMALALCAALCLGLAACGENAASSTASGANAPGFEGEEAPDYNLITGQPLAEGMAVGQRPVAVMVRAERAGWPQSGLAGADALVEMATQGGQTALMALYANAATIWTEYSRQRMLRWRLHDHVPAPPVQRSVLSLPK